MKVRDHIVKIRKIFAGSLVALLLCVSSLAAACDLSCGFAQFRSDCHSPQMVADGSSPSDMTMAGMTMPEGAGGSYGIDQQVTIPAPRPMPAHAVLADMGACERQSCDQGQALTSRANHSVAAQFETISTVARFSRIDSLRASFHGARGDIAPLSPVVHSPLSVTLRL